MNLTPTERGWLIGIILAIGIGMAIVDVIVTRQDAQRAAAHEIEVDKLCAHHSLTGHAILMGRTILGERLCVDPTSGIIFDPDSLP